jgi:hypothetical protein
VRLSRNEKQGIANVTALYGHKLCAAEIRDTSSGRGQTSLTEHQ